MLDLADSRVVHAYSHEGNDKRAKMEQTIRTQADDTLDAQYYALERPCCCLDGYVFIGFEGEDGEEYFERYACRRCGEGV